MTVSATLVTALREAGLRATAPRIAVLEILQGMSGHPDAETITAAVRERLGTVSTQTVYDVLHALSGAGLVRRLEMAGGPAARFELNVHDDHHHLSCTSCHRVVDVDSAEDAPCLESVSGHGFEIHEVVVVFQGLCPECRQGRAESA